MSLKFVLHYIIKKYHRLEIHTRSAFTLNYFEDSFMNYEFEVICECRWFCERIWQERLNVTGFHETKKVTTCRL